jgi:hypothetical protein
MATALVVVLMTVFAATLALSTLTVAKQLVEQARGRAPQ